MIDTLEPFFIKLEEERELGTPFKDGYILALNEARNGMESTEDIISNKGRSKRLGHRSKGFKDPGAFLSRFNSYNLSTHCHNLCIITKLSTLS